MSTQAPPPGAATDPSMEDILASIRRILSEDEAAPAATGAAQPAPAPAPAGAPANGGDVLALDDSMLVAEPIVPLASAAPDPAAAAVEDVMTEPAQAATRGAPEPPRAPPDERLIAPEAEAAATSAMGSLLRTLEQGREPPAGESTPVYRGGPTLEDMVREELRPLLKSWLDSNLPPLVERLVRAEIARLAGRAVS